jgi:ribosomal protein L11 methyltransferase
VIRLAVRVARRDAELVLAELLALAPGGLEERDVSADEVEYALYGAPGELPALPALRAAAGSALVGLSSTEVPEDWAQRWRAWHRPVEVGGGRLRVRPPWEPAVTSPPAPLDLVIDPGQAFGTGAHATTRLCLELLLEVQTGGRGGFADWGTGSGVLAIAAARLGFAPVLACDFEAAALVATGENAARNGVAVRGEAAAPGGDGPALALARVDLRREPAPWAPTVTANLARGLLLAVAARLERPPERLIASGLLREEADAVAAGFARHGLRERDRRAEAEWAALLLAT